MVGASQTGKTTFIQKALKRSNPDSLHGSIVITEERRGERREKVCSFDNVGDKYALDLQLEKETVHLEIVEVPSDATEDQLAKVRTLHPTNSSLSFYSAKRREIE